MNSRGQWNRVQHVEGSGDWSAEEVEPGLSLFFTLGGGGLYFMETELKCSKSLLVVWVIFFFSLPPLSPYHWTACHKQDIMSRATLM